MRNFVTEQSAHNSTVNTLNNSKQADRRLKYTLTVCAGSAKNTRAMIIDAASEQLNIFLTAHQHNIVVHVAK